MCETKKKTKEYYGDRFGKKGLKEDKTHSYISQYTQTNKQTNKRKKVNISITLLIKKK